MTHHLLPSRMHQQEARWEVEKPGFEPAWMQALQVVLHPPHHNACPSHNYQLSIKCISDTVKISLDLGKNWSQRDIDLVEMDLVAETWESPESRFCCWVGR